MGEIVEKFTEDGQKYWTDGNKVVYEKTIDDLIYQINEAEKRFWESLRELENIDPIFKHEN